VSNQPSDAFRQHHDLEAPRVDWRAFRQGTAARGPAQRVPGVATRREGVGATFATRGHDGAA
jgi:hypothetical protein